MRTSRCALAWLLSFQAWAGTADLSWTAPTQNVDGSAYTNPGGYRVYRRCDAGALAQIADVPHAQLAYADSGMPDDGRTCWYSLTAYNALNEESARTNEVSKTFAAASVELPGSVSATFSWSFQGPPDVALSDTGLVARYYLDEQASGITDGSTVVDASSNGYDLTINDGAGTTDLEYTEVSGNRGLDFKDTAGAQRVYRAINNTSDAVRDALSGAGTVTIEVVIDLTAGNASNGRVVVINDRVGGSPVFGITDTTTEHRLYVNESHVALGGTLGSGRKVMHYVFDGGNYAWYTDGASSGSGSGLNATITMGSNLDLIFGNRESSGSFARAIDGIIYYVALYSVAFDSTRVSDHYDVLVADDDTPSGATASLPINRSARMAVMIAH